MTHLPIRPRGIEMQEGEKKAEKACNSQSDQEELKSFN